MSNLDVLTDRRTVGLAPDAHAVVLADDLVFLDVEADAYFCLPFGAVKAELDGSRRLLTSGDGELLAALQEAGLIGVSPIADAAPATAPPPRVTAARPPLPAVGWRDIAEACSCVWDIIRHYRGHTLADLLRQAAQRKLSGCTCAPTPEALALIARFRRWSPFAPVSGKCLLRAFMLLRLLNRHGHDAQWIFGVATWPFAAHCWLQIGDVVLDDDVERLAVYRAILVA